MNNRPIQSKLEPLKWRHARDLQRVVNDPAMTEWSNMPQVYFSNGAQSLIQRSLHQAQNNGDHLLALYIEADLSGVFSIQRESGRAKIGHLFFWIEPTCWKSGKSIDYLSDVVTFAMQKLKLSQLMTCCYERNTLCTRALESVGFKRIGRRRSDGPGSAGEDTELSFVVQAK